jgi:parallel beta-helix repeat protein
VYLYNSDNNIINNIILNNKASIYGGGFVINIQMNVK